MCSGHLAFQAMQRYTAGSLVIHKSEQQHARPGSVLSWQARQLFVKALEAQIEVKRSRVFVEQLANGLEADRIIRRNDRDASLAIWYF